VVKAMNASGCEISQSITVTRNSSGGWGGGTIFIGGGNNYCGDGVRRSTEQCDDGNNRNGDGCDMNCYLETVAKVSSWVVTNPLQKKIIAKNLPKTSPVLRLGTIVAPTILPKTGGIQDILAFLLQLIQSVIA
jgi:cysteine-rich repeat protein